MATNVTPPVAATTPTAPAGTAAPVPATSVTPSAAPVPAPPAPAKPGDIPVSGTPATPPAPSAPETVPDTPSGEEFKGVVDEEILPVATQKAMVELIGDQEVANTVLEAYSYVDQLRNTVGLVPSAEDVNTLYQVNEEYSSFLGGLTSGEPQAALEMIMVTNNEQGKPVITPEGQGIINGLANIIPLLPPRYSNIIAQATMEPIITGLLKEASDLRASAEYILGQRLEHRRADGEEQQRQAAEMFSLVALLEARFLGHQSKPEDLLAGRRTPKVVTEEEKRLEEEKQRFRAEQKAHQDSLTNAQNGQIYEYMKAPIMSAIDNFLIKQDIGNGQTIGQFLGEDAVKQAAVELYEAASESVNKLVPLIKSVNYHVSQFRKTGDRTHLDNANKELEPAFRKAIKVNAPIIRNKWINQSVLTQQQSVANRQQAATTHAATAPAANPAAPAPTSRPAARVSSTEDWIRKS